MTTKLTARQQDKLIEAAQNAIEFTVEGSGPFPIDMLRYDLCWPAKEAHSYHLLITDDRRIVLKGLKLPTTRRWESFGWRVVAS